MNCDFLLKIIVFKGLYNARIFLINIYTVISTVVFFKDLIIMFLFNQFVIIIIVI